VALDPLNEEAQRRLMQLYAWSGRRTAALRQYNSCVQVLQEELGVQPAAETTQLFEMIKAGQLSAPAAAPPVHFVQPEISPLHHEIDLPDATRPLFVAREAEMARLEEFLTRALAGQGQVVFITGEAGSGKSMLLQEFVRRALITHADLLVAGGNCNAFTGIGDPYLPFRELLQQLTGDMESEFIDCPLGAWVSGKSKATPNGYAGGNARPD
jgi:hypothetical protein